MIIKMPDKKSLEEGLKGLGKKPSLEEMLRNLGKDLDEKLSGLKKAMPSEIQAKPRTKKTDYEDYGWVNDFWAFYKRAEEFREKGETENFLKETEYWYAFTLKNKKILPSNRDGMIHSYFLDAHWKTAIDYIGENKLAEAGFIFGRITKIDGTLVMPNYIILERRFFKERNEKFNECIEAALKKDPDNWGCLIAQHPFQNYSNKDLVELMIEHYGEPAQHDAAAHYILGEKLNEVGEHEAALAELTYANGIAEERGFVKANIQNEISRAVIKITKDSKEYAKNFREGLERYFKGDNRKAEEFLGKALASKPSSKVCKVYLGAVQQGKKHPVKIEVSDAR